MASHNLNDTSSRSHAMLSIQVEQDITESENSAQQMTRQGKLIFVDLAGKILFHEKLLLFFIQQAAKRLKQVYRKVSN